MFRSACREVVWGHFQGVRAARHPRAMFSGASREALKEHNLGFRQGGRHVYGDNMACVNSKIRDDVRTRTYILLRVLIKNGENFPHT